MPRLRQILRGIKILRATSSPMPANHSTNFEEDETSLDFQQPYLQLHHVMGGNSGDFLLVLPLW